MIHGALSMLSLLVHSGLLLFLLSSHPLQKGLFAFALTIAAVSTPLDGRRGWNLDRGAISLSELGGGGGFGSGESQVRVKMESRESRLRESRESPNRLNKESKESQKRIERQ